MEKIYHKAKTKLHKIEQIQRFMILLFILITFAFIYLIYLSITTHFISFIYVILISYICMGSTNYILNQRKSKHESILKAIDAYKLKQNLNLELFSPYHGRYKEEYLNELHITSSHSLFQLLNVAKSKQGKDKVIARMSNVTNDIDIMQEAIEEISKDPQCIIDLQCALKEDSDLEQIVEAMDFNHKKINMLLYIDLVIDLFCLYIVMQYQKLILLVVVIRYIIARIYAVLFKDYFKNTSAVVEMINTMFIVPSTNFHSKKIKDIQSEIQKVKHYQKYFQILDILDSFNNNIISSLLLNTFGSLSLLIIYYHNKIDQFIHFESFIDAFSELEMIVSYASIFYLDLSYCKGKVSEKLTIQDGYHPLVKGCIKNDYKGNPPVIITGSNMSGKTTYLRMIGLNCCMFNACGYAFASKFESPIYHIMTSISIQDDLEKGISTFYGELLRIKKAMDLPNPKLILIDEIFKGTNYHDRILGAKKVIEKLRDANIHLIITTHDFELCDEQVDNYYFEEKYSNDEIVFDYQVHAGKSSTSNALFLMKKLSIISNEDIHS